MFNLRESVDIGSGGFDIGSLDTYYEACEKFGGRWMGNDDWWLIVDYWLSSHGKYGGCGGPQADGVRERESSEFKRNLNGGPQADDGEEQQLENNKYPQMSQMDTD